MVCFNVLTRSRETLLVGPADSVVGKGIRLNEPVDPGALGDDRLGFIPENRTGDGFVFFWEFCTRSTYRPGMWMLSGDGLRPGRAVLGTIDTLADREGGEIRRFASERKEDGGAITLC